MQYLQIPAADKADMQASDIGEQSAGLRVSIPSARLITICFLSIHGDEGVKCMDERRTWLSMVPELFGSHIEQHEL